MDHAFELLDGTKTNLAAYRGKAVLVVNTASECGYTPQYKGLEELYQAYRARGLEVLAFPSNDFGRQEPGTDAEIKTFCERRYKTTFPLFAKIPVKGKAAAPLFVPLQGDASSRTARGSLRSHATPRFRSAWRHRAPVQARRGRSRQRRGRVCRGDAARARAALRPPTQSGRP